MKKKTYEAPAMEFVGWLQQTQLLASSETSADVDVTLEEEDWIISSASGRSGISDEF